MSIKGQLDRERRALERKAIEERAERLRALGFVVTVEPDGSLKVRPSGEQ
ncbi:MAG TPA: hypothetical protein VFF73_41070 [Planctomycetota bacterium]|nr:hypothetical protein [Planctomycetota bacterium]